MAALPYMQLYVADYLADTAHLNAAQHGAYLLLLMNYWQRGKALVNSNERLANVARMSNDQWNENKDVLAEFFTVTETEWIHNRVEGDLEKVRAKSTKASEAGRASAERRMNNRSTDYAANVPTNVEQTFNHTDTDTDTDTELRTNTASIANAIPASPPFITFPLLKGKKHIITENDVKVYEETYPAVNVRQELREVASWLDANSDKRSQSIKGSKQRIVRWLGKEQDKGGTKPNARPDAVLERQKQNLANIEAAARRLEGANGAGNGFLSQPDASSRNARRLHDGLEPDRGEVWGEPIPERPVERSSQVGLLSLAEGYRGRM